MFRQEYEEIEVFKNDRQTLLDYCEEHGYSTPTLIRELIERYLDRLAHEDD